MINRLHKLIRNIPDFPIPGIQFKDITPVFSDPKVLHWVIEQMVASVPKDVNKIVAIESRGFLFAVPMAMELGLPFIPVRKPGKLPYKTKSLEYALEYGTGKLEIHEDAIEAGDRVAIVDDLLATGGTVKAVRDLVASMGGNSLSAHFMIELEFLKAREKLAGLPIHRVVHF